MRRILIVVSLLGGALAAAQKRPPVPPVPPVHPPPLPPSTEDALYADLAAAKWTPSEKAGLPAGAELALIGADPVSTGVTAYLKAPAGWRLPPHWHTHTEYSTMIVGKGTLTIAGKAHAVGPGAYAVIPGKTEHSFVCEVDPQAQIGGLPGCIVLVRRSGPTDVHWVDTKK